LCFFFFFFFIINWLFFFFFFFQAEDGIRDLYVTGVQTCALPISTLLGSAVSLNRAGYPLLVFDFRGHGASAGSGSDLGVSEKRDIEGAVEYLKGRGDI